MTERLSDRPLSTLTSSEKRELLKQLLQRRLEGSTGGFPLSYGQRALWFIYLMAPETASYNIAIAAEACPAFDLDHLRRALDIVRQRHPALRTTFTAHDGTPLQLVHDHPPVWLTIVDGAHLAQAELIDAVTAEYRRPLDLAVSPCRATVFRALDRDILLVTVHHIAFDATSAHVFLNEVRLAYEALVDGRQPEMPTVTAAYRDFVEWQSSAIDSSSGAESWAYWADRLSGTLPVLSLPGVEESATCLPNASVSFAVSAETSQSLNTLARERRVTMAALLLAAYSTLLQRLSGQDDLIIGMPVSGRNRPEWAGAIGYFVNMLPLRFRFSSGQRFEEHLARTAEELRGGQAHDDFPFSLMVERLKASRRPGLSPVFQAVLHVHATRQLGEFVRLFNGEGEPVRFGGSALRGIPLAQQEGQFDLAAEVIDAGGGLTGRIKYGAGMLGAHDRIRIATAFASLLEQIGKDPGACLADYAIEAIPNREIEDREDLVL